MRARDLSSPLKQQFSSSSTAVTLDELNPLGDLKLSVEDGTSDKSDKAAKAVLNFLWHFGIFSVVL
jgi:hypothetical protein